MARARKGQLTLHWYAFPVEIWDDERVTEDPRVAQAMATLNAAWGKMKKRRTGGFIGDNSLRLLPTPNPEEDMTILSRTSPPFVERVEGGWLSNDPLYSYGGWNETETKAEEDARCAKERDRKKAPGQLELLPGGSAPTEAYSGPPSGPRLAAATAAASPPPSPIPTPIPSEIPPSPSSSSDLVQEEKTLPDTARAETGTPPRTEAPMPIPEAWEFGEAERTEAVACGVPLAEAPRIFRVFKATAQEKGKTAVDWLAAWRAWCSRERGFERPRVGPRSAAAKQPPNPSTIADFERTKREADAAWERRAALSPEDRAREDAEIEAQLAALGLPPQPPPLARAQA